MNERSLASCAIIFPRRKVNGDVMRGGGGKAHPPSVGDAVPVGACRTICEFSKRDQDGQQAPGRGWPELTF